MYQVFPSISILNFLFTDFFHLFFYISFILILYLFKILNKKIFFFLLVTSPTPFIFNNFIFIKFFPDTVDYLETINHYRGYHKLNHQYLGDNKVLSYSYIISFIPVPFVFTKVSLGYISKFIFTILVTYLSNKNKSNNFLLFLILLTPELIMYSSIGLKETLIIFFMSLALINYTFKKYIFFSIYLVPLFFIKIQCFYFLVFFIFIHQFFLIIKLKNNLIKKLLFILFSNIILITILYSLNHDLTNTIIYQLDFYCRKLNYVSFCYKDTRDFISQFDSRFINFFLTPIGQKEISILMIMQFISSSYYLLAILILIYLSNHTIEIKYTMIFYIIFVAMVLGTIVSNDGLLTRQKFSAIFPIILLLFINTDLHKISFSNIFFIKPKT